MACLRRRAVDLRASEAPQDKHTTTSLNPLANSTNHRKTLIELEQIPDRNFTTEQPQPPPICLSRAQNMVMLVNAQTNLPANVIQDRGINTFSPEGRLFQVEYSLEAIKLGSTAIGVTTSSGTILGVEKRITSTLLETSSVEKVVEIDRHIGCAMSGLQADARSMVEHARVTSQSHAFHFNEAIGVESCTQAICDLALRFGESASGEEEESIMSRPFGVALLIAGYDEEGPSLYVAETLED